jgi:parallel beta-helix repeat protein
MHIHRLAGAAAIALLLAVIGSPAMAQCPAQGSCPTADEVAVQGMLDAAAAAGGGIVQLEPRVYLICSPLIIGSNTHLKGAGRGATIIRGSQIANGVVVNNSYVSATIGTAGTTNVTVSDLTIDHVTCNRLANGVAFVPATLPGSPAEAYDGTLPTNGFIARVEVKGSDEPHAYMIWNLKGQHMKIVDNWVDGGASAESNQEGIESFGGHDVLISGNTVKNIGYSCISAGSAGLPGSDTLGVQIVNNFLTDCTVGINLGTALASGVPQSQANTRVLSNVIKSVRRIGIDVSVVPGTVQRDLMIAHNSIRDINDDSAIGIMLRSSGGTIDGSSVIANTIHDNHIENIRGVNSHGIRVTQYPNVRIAENTLNGMDHGGIYALDSDDLEITGNQIDGGGLSAIQLWGTSVGFDRFVVERNLIRDWPGTSSGILVVTGHYGTIKDNVLKRNDAAKPVPIVVTAQSCGVSVNRNVPWYYPTWPGTFVPDCP